MTGTIEGSRTELWVSVADGKRYKIHFSERHRAEVGLESAGLSVEFEAAPEIVSPRDFDGWVRNGSLQLA